MDIEFGITLNDWAIPLHIFIGKPFTTSDGGWVTQVVITVLCFYVAFTWPRDEGGIHREEMHPW